jgi:hypothetical protein
VTGAPASRHSEASEALRQAYVLLAAIGRRAKAEQSQDSSDTPRRTFSVPPGVEVRQSTIASARDKEKAPVAAGADEIHPTTAQSKGSSR